MQVAELLTCLTPLSIGKTEWRPAALGGMERRRAALLFSSRRYGSHVAPKRDLRRTQPIASNDSDRQPIKETIARGVSTFFYILKLLDIYKEARKNLNPN
jgi:hypothetical protein